MYWIKYKLLYEDTPYQYVQIDREEYELLCNSDYSTINTIISAYNINLKPITYSALSAAELVEEDIDAIIMQCNKEIDMLQDEISSKQEMKRYLLNLSYKKFL